MKSTSPLESGGRADYMGTNPYSSNFITKIQSSDKPVSRLQSDIDWRNFSIFLVLWAWIKKTCLFYICLAVIRAVVRKVRYWSCRSAAGCNFAETRRFFYFSGFIFVTPWSNFIIIYEACCHAINSWWCIPLLWENRFSDLCHYSRGWLLTDHSREVVLWASLFVSKVRYLCV